MHCEVSTQEFFRTREKCFSHFSSVLNKRSRERKGLTFVATLHAEILETLADSYITLGRHLGITKYTLTNMATSELF